MAGVSPLFPTVLQHHQAVPSLDSKLYMYDCILCPKQYYLYPVQHFTSLYLWIHLHIATGTMHPDTSGTVDPWLLLRRNHPSRTQTHVSHHLARYCTSLLVGDLARVECDTANGVVTGHQSAAMEELCVDRTRYFPDD